LIDKNIFYVNNINNTLILI